VHQTDPLLPAAVTWPQLCRTLTLACLLTLTFATFSLEAICDVYVEMPCLQALVGDRYGFRPLLSEIEREEFDMLLSIVREKDEETAAILESWFQLDSNSIPANYVLQVIIEEQCKIIQQATNNKRKIIYLYKWCTSYCVLSFCIVKTCLTSQ
jgi:hypothetical protein